MKKLTAVIFALICIIGAVSIMAATVSAKEEPLAIKEFSIADGIRTDAVCGSFASFVTGGTKPYTYSIEAEGGSLLYKDICIDSDTGAYVYNREHVRTTTAYASLTVTDANGKTATQKLSFGKVTQPADLVVYPVYVGGVHVSNKNMTDITGSKTAVYTPATATDSAVLTLNKASVTTGFQTTTADGVCLAAAVYTQENLVIKLTGTSTLSVAGLSACTNNEGDCTFYSVAADDTAGITFSGSGTLSAADGIYREFSQLVMKGGTVSGKIADYNTYGVLYYGGTLNVWGEATDTQDITFIEYADGVSPDTHYIEASNSVDGSNPFFLTAEETQGYCFAQGHDGKALLNITVSEKEAINTTNSFDYYVSYNPDDIDTTMNTVPVRLFVPASYEKAMISGKSEEIINVPAYIVSDTIPYEKNTENFKKGVTYSICNGDLDDFLEEFINSRIKEKYYVRPERIFFFGESFSIENLSAAYFTAEEPAITKVKVLGRRITDSNKNDILGDGTFSYLPETNTVVIKKDITIPTTTAFLIFDQYDTGNTVNVLIKKECTSITVPNYLFGCDTLSLKAEGDISFVFSGYFVIGNDVEIIGDGNISITPKEYVYTFFECEKLSITAKKNLYIAGEECCVSVANTVSINCGGDFYASATKYPCFVSIETADINAGGSITLKQEKGMLFAGPDIAVVNISCGKDFTVDIKNCIAFDVGSAVISADGKVSITADNSYVSRLAFSVAKASCVDITGTSLLFINNADITSSGDINITDSASLVGCLGHLKAKNITIRICTANVVFNSENTAFECENLLIENTLEDTDINPGIHTKDFTFINPCDTCTVTAYDRSGAATILAAGSEKEYKIPYVTDSSYKYVKISAATHSHTFTGTVAPDGNGKHRVACNSCDAIGTPVACTPVITNATAATTTTPGFTGDKVCSVCGQLLEKGTEIPVTAPAVTYGDVNGDGVVGVADARLALRRAIGLEDYAVGSAEYIACDVNFSGDVRVDDARLILRAAIGLEDRTTWVAPQ